MAIMAMAILKSNMALFDIPLKSTQKLNQYTLQKSVKRKRREGFFTIQLNTWPDSENSSKI